MLTHIHILQHGEDDTSQFDAKFTQMPPVDSPVESKLSESANLNFQVSTFVQMLADFPNLKSA